MNLESTPNLGSEARLTAVTAATRMAPVTIAPGCLDQMKGFGNHFYYFERSVYRQSKKQGSLTSGIDNKGVLEKP